MKNIKSIRYCVGTLLLLATTAAPVGAVTYTMPHYAIGGGGGTSVGAQFRVAGIIGQAVAGEQSSGQFTVQSGFGLIPMGRCTFVGIHLTALGNGVVRVSWPLPECGSVLYRSRDLVAWEPLSTAFEVHSDHLSALRNEQAEFFRLGPP